MNIHGKGLPGNSINRIRLEFKVDCRCLQTGYFIVLIESDWNLKIKYSASSAIVSGINRIRLEFKDK